MVVDHDVDRQHARGRALAEDGRLHVDQRERRRTRSSSSGVMRADLDAERAHHRAVLGPLHLAERDRAARSGDLRPSSARSASRAAMPSGSGSGWSRIATFSRALEQLAQLHDAAQVLEVVETRRSTSSRISERSPVCAQARVGRQLLGRDAVREQQDGRAGQRVRDRGQRRAREGRGLGHDDEVVPRLRLRAWRSTRQRGRPAARGSPPAARATRPRPGGPR